jgi:hypothetical protein
MSGGGTTSGLRHAVFPIYGQEIVKFVLIAGIKFFVVFVLTLTRDTKDTLMVTGENGGGIKRKRRMRERNEGLRKSSEPSSTISNHLKPSQTISN